MNLSELYEHDLIDKLIKSTVFSIHFPVMLCVPLLEISCAVQPGKLIECSFCYEDVTC